MESATVTQAQPEEKPSTKDRSSIEFPYADLDASFAVVNGVHNAGGTTCAADQLAAQLKLEAKGGGFRLRVNAARIFGLITYDRGGRIALTEIGRQAIDPQTERAARVKAFLSVPLFSRVYDEYKGGPIPPRAALERALVSFGVAEKVKDRARQVLDRSAKQAGFYDAAADRLVTPRTPHAENGAETQDDTKNNDDPIDKNNKGGGGSGGGMHPAFQLLLQTLPEPGTEWDSNNRMNWLMLANSAFNMIYRPGNGDAQIEIKLKDK